MKEILRNFASFWKYFIESNSQKMKDAKNPQNLEIIEEWTREQGGEHLKLFSMAALKQAPLNGFSLGDEISLWISMIGGGFMSREIRGSHCGRRRWASDIRLMEFI